ncbi:hypothetical protein GCK32_018879, partial [Trichostrongylus colubriformis]
FNSFQSEAFGRQLERFRSGPVRNTKMGHRL